MRRRGSLLVMVTFAAATVLSAVPVRAASLSYADPAGDANQVFGVVTPRPSDPELDVLNVNWTSSAETLTIVTKFTELGEPAGSNGSSYIHSFVYEGTRYEFLQQSPASPSSQLFTPGIYFRPTDDPTTEFGCATCSARFDFTAKTLTITAGIKSMAAAFRSYDPEALRFGPGSALDGLVTTTQRFTVLLSTSDAAAPPPEATLII